MAVPKKKTSRSKRNMRRSHDSLSGVNTVVCENCGDSKMRHRVCPSCGTYRGRQVVKMDDENL
ncbi:50S ribosomal protein L32 [bacterium]|nr:50S ribosomal protein L32 [bacterium]